VAAGGAGASLGAAGDGLKDAIIGALADGFKMLQVGRATKPPPSSGTRALGARKARRRLGSRVLQGLPADAIGDAVLSAAELSQLRGRGDESSVLAFLAGRMKQLRELPAAAEDLGLVLVNSEVLQWLNPGLDDDEPADDDNCLKPDWFLTWKPFVTFTGRTRGGLPEGRLASIQLQYDGCVAEFYEGKKEKMTDSDLGQLISYHDCMPTQCNGMLLCKTGFSLYRSTETVPERLIERIPWIAAGSKAAIKSHFEPVAEPKLLKALRALLSDFGVALDYSRPAGAFLGAGAYGRVFAVKDAGGAQQALKVCLYDGEESWAALLQHEHDSVVAAAAAGAPVIATASPLRLNKPAGYGGYVLREVGFPVEELKTLPDKKEAFAALAELHARGFTHGDARLPNLLRLSSNKLVWVDFRGSLSAMSAEDISTDASMLMSFCENPPENAEARIEHYGEQMMSLIASEPGVEPLPLEEVLPAAKALADAIFA